MKIILERYTSAAARSGSHLQKHYIASALTFHVTEGKEDAGWMPDQAAEIRHKAHCSRLQKKIHSNKNVSTVQSF